MKLNPLKLALKIGMIAAFALALPMASAEAGEDCPYSSGTTEAKKDTKVKKLKVAELAKMLEGKAKPAVFDANSDETRENYGVIPGATLLASYTDYDVAEVLPASKNSKIVFYCGSTRCSAAETAATKAIDAGYTKVAVLPAGIKGWKKAGKKTVQPAKRS